MKPLALMAIGAALVGAGAVAFVILRKQAVQANALGGNTGSPDNPGGDGSATGSWGSWLY